MNFLEAAEIVLDLARDNALNPNDVDPDLVDEAYRQDQALDVVAVRCAELGEAQLGKYQPGTPEYVLNNLHIALQEAQNGASVDEMLSAVGYADIPQALADIEAVRDRDTEE